MAGGIGGGGGYLQFIPSTTVRWFDLQIGGGGFVTGMSIVPDGTMAVRTDTYGGYYKAPGATSWTQVLTFNGMPAGDATIETAGGLYEIVVCPNQTTKLYMYFSGRVYISTNSGMTWTRTAFAQVTADPNAAARTMGRFMAVDPINANVLYVGTPSSGVWVTTDGGTTFTQVTAVGSSSSSGNSLIAFDAHSAQSGGKTQGVYISTYGTGVYYTNNAGSSWGLTNGGSGSMPTTHNHLVVDQNGVAWLVDNNSGVIGNNGTINKYSGGGTLGTWTSIANGANNTRSIAVDPTNASNILICSAISAIAYSTNALTSITNLQFNETITGDQTWANQASAVNFSFSISDVQYDPSQAGVVWMTEGFGVNWFKPALNVGTSSVVINTLVTGIEQLVATAVLAPPATSNVILGSEDFFVQYKPSATFGQNLDAIRPSYVTPFSTLGIGYLFDYAPSTPTTIFGLIAGGVIESFGQDFSGKSTDGGNTWTQFASVPPTISNGGGGNIAAASTTNLVIVYAGSGTPYFSTNGGSTWTASTGVSSIFVVDTVIRTILAADKVNIGTFYLFKAGDGFYKSTNNGATWSKTASDADSAHSGFSMIYKASPTVAGDLWYTSGYLQGASHPVTSELLYRSTDAGSTFTTISGFAEVTAIGFGAQAPGHSYPLIGVAGWYNGVYGIYQSSDNGSTWVKIGDYPTGNFQYLRSIDGDKITQGTWYAAINGSGFVYGALR